MSDWYNDFKACKELNKEELQSKRMIYAKQEISKLGFQITESDETKLKIYDKQKDFIYFFPFTGWASGKRIKDGRGINHLKRELKKLLDESK